jgi:acetyl esterase
VTQQPVDDIPAERVLDALRAMPADQVVEPGVTAGDARTVMTTPPAPTGYVHEPNVVYGTAGRDGRPLTLHLYRPVDIATPRPGVVFVHGGGFQEGFPEMLTRYAGFLAAEGYVTAAIRYRLSGEACWPAPVEDAKCAVRWMRANARSLGVDPGRIAVAGNSAGGNLAAMVSTTPGRFEGEGGHDGVSSAVSAAVLWYPAVDLRPSRTGPILHAIVDKLFGQEGVTDDVAVAGSPLVYVDEAPPTLTFTGDADPLVTPDGAIAYHARLDEIGVPNQLTIVPGVGHSFDFSLARWDECFASMRSFLATHM